MGQSFYLVNLDKRQASYLGKYGEMFFGGLTLDELINRLMRRLSFPSEPLSNDGNRLKGLQAAIDTRLAKRRAHRDRLTKRPLRFKKDICDLELHEREDDDDYRLRWVCSIPR